MEIKSKTRWINEQAQQKYYKKRIGTVYGDFIVTNVWYDWDNRKQVWKMKCKNCGAERITRNGNDYIRGRNSGRCQCTVEKRRADKKSEEESEQAKNKRPSSELGEREGYRLFTIDGETKSISKWCKQYGVSVPFVEYRIREKGMTIYEALTTPKLTAGRPLKSK